MERHDVEFQSEDATVRAWFYRAAGGGRRPTVVLAGGWCYVREIVMPTYAKAFAAAGINAMIFDYRNLWRQRRRQPAASRSLGANSRLSERRFISRAPRSGRPAPHRRMGHLLFRRSCADPRRYRPTRKVDRQPDSRDRRLREHASRPRHHRVPAALGSHPQGPQAPLRTPGRATLPAARDREFGSRGLLVAFPGDRPHLHGHQSQRGPALSEQEHGRIRSTS